MFFRTPKTLITNEQFENLKIDFINYLIDMDDSQDYYYCYDKARGFLDGYLNAISCHITTEQDEELIKIREEEIGKDEDF